MSKMPFRLLCRPNSSFAITIHIEACKITTTVTCAFDVRYWDENGIIVAYVGLRVRIHCECKDT